MLRAVLSFVLGLASLVLSAEVLLAGYAWPTFVWSGGEYAERPPSLGHKIGDVLPWALGTLAVAAILAITGVFLILISRRGLRRSRVVATHR